MMPFKFIRFGLIILALLFILSFPSYSFAQSTQCSNEAPADAPNLYQVSASSGSATLYFAQPSSTFDGYIISYGLTQNADSYSVSFNEGSLNGATTYTVNDLFPNTNYYFKVRATNGCATGPWSETVSTNLAGAGSLPETGPSTALIGIGLSGLALVAVGLVALFLVL